MKKVLVLMMLAVVGLVGGLAGCSRGESTITGSYGSSMISGEVYLAGVTNTSPAGVQVSVRGTGMTAILAADGRFAFANVPDGAVLDFQRSSDAIDASLDLDGAASFVTVELRQANAVATTAKKSGRRRAGAGGGEKLYEFEGVIRTAAADSIVVYTSHKEEVTIGLAAETVIRKGHTSLTPADLTVDTRVHVKARSANDAYTAVLVIVQNQGDGGDDDVPPPATVREYEGRVVGATADSLTVFTSKKTEVTFLITPGTEVRRSSVGINLAQVLIGMLVHVKATANADGTNTATLVIVQNTNVKAEIEGTVASIDGTSLVVTTATGDVTVTTSPSTQIRRGGKKVAFSAIAAGAKVEAEGTMIAATTLQAKKINVED
ncbi:MAG TPA: DUF5666 domain-containing protein [Thermoanaerobaculia bacterium]|jgi:hypothetical protein